MLEGMARLTPRQAAFVREYLVDLNATQAAIRAGYSARTAYSQGQRLLKHVEVQKAVTEAKAKRAERVEVQADDVLRGLLRIADVDLREAFDPKTGQLLPIHELPEDVAKAISGVDVVHLPDGAGVLHKVRFWDRVKALDLLGRHLKLFTDKVEHSGAVTIQVVNPYAEGSE